MDATFRIERNSMILEEVATTIYTIIPLLVFILNTRNIITPSTEIFYSIDIVDAHLYESSVLKCSFPFDVLCHYLRLFHVKHFLPASAFHVKLNSL